MTRGASTADAARPRSQRQLRVAEEIRHVLAECFARGGFRDPDLAGVQITVSEVRVSPDLKNATAFVCLLGSDGIGEKLPALTRAAPYFRHQVAQALRLRVAPTISFQPDVTVQYAAKIDRLLHAPEVARDLDGRAPGLPTGDSED